jgi:hypothetical protein
VEEQVPNTFNNPIVGFFSFPFFPSSSFFLYLDRVLLYSPGWPQIPSCHFNRQAPGSQA